MISALVRRVREVRSTGSTGKIAQSILRMRVRRRVVGAGDHGKYTLYLQTKWQTNGESVKERHWAQLVVDLFSSREDRVAWMGSKVVDRSGEVSVWILECARKDLGEN